MSVPRPGVAATKRVLKRLRSMELVNRPATTSARAVVRGLGMDDSLAVKHLHRIGTVRCRLPDGDVLRLRACGDEWVTNQLFWRGFDTYEPESMPVFLQHAGGAPTIIDVGAHIGMYSLTAAKMNPDARVIAFEPMPDVHRRLVDNIELNSLRNVTSVAAAVSDSEGTAVFYHARMEGLPSSSSLSREFMDYYEGIGTTSVRLVTLDAFCAEHDVRRVDLVKVDTESTEPAVLRGMQAVLERDRPTILCEVLPGYGVEPELEAVLRPLGYSFDLLTDQGPQPREQITGDDRWRNYLFTAERPH
jgi:FkbM family methyltransferase